MTDENQAMYRRLRGTVRMLASTADVQVAYLNEASRQAKYQVLADDITTEFECWLKYAEKFAAEGLLSPQSLDALRTLSEQIDCVGAAVEHWTADALAKSDTWAAVREQARIALASMDKRQPPAA